MKVSELKTLLNTFDDNDECYYSQKRGNLMLEDLQVSEYQGEIVFHNGIVDLEERYEERRVIIENDIQRQEDRLTELKAKRDKQKPKPNN